MFSVRFYMGMRLERVSLVTRHFLPIKFLYDFKKLEAKNVSKKVKTKRQFSDSF